MNELNKLDQAEQRIYFVLECYKITSCMGSPENDSGSVKMFK